ncbi:MAG TPA: HAMP domain-containing sensor histidine kinase [Solirubrobacteraceae bacterium]|jgi:signal transduction histidine kinase|nr:HAMP domain-containing sensor histidine kinase [Solirubrobacteraceae bacterium]
MTGRSRLAALRHPWPRRLRTRLAVFYSLLFLAAGLGLLALAYTLANPLLAPARQPDLQRLTSTQLSLLRQCKPPPGVPKLARECLQLLSLITPTQNGTALAVVKVGALTGGALVIVAAVVLGWLAAGRALQPVRAITEAALRASELRLGQRLALSGPEDELKALGDTFDVMLERLDATFTSQQRFVANAAHELRTPLTAMRTAIDVTLAKPERTPEQLEEMAERVRRSVQRAEATIEALLTLATSELGAAAAERLDLATAAEDALDAVRATIAQRELRVEASLEPAPTRGDRVLLERMVANLVENAVRHNHRGGSIWIRTRHQDGSSVLEVENTGPQVAAGQIPVLFEPFARAEQRVSFDQGVGLGLSIAEAIARAHDAEISARERDGGGLALTVTVPGH